MREHILIRGKAGCLEESGKEDAVCIVSCRCEVMMSTIRALVGYLIVIESCLLVDVLEALSSLLQRDPCTVFYR